MFKKTFFLALAFFCILTAQGKAVTSTGTIKVAIEGFLNSDLHHNIRDTVTIYLSRSNNSEVKIDTAKSVIDSVTLIGTFIFNKNNINGNYYIIVQHRNSVMTWSQPIYLTFGSGATFSYDFTTSASKAFGNNLILKNSIYCIYSGDINQDGVVDASDVSIVENDATNSLSGYVISDVTGDKYVDASDISIVVNNSESGVITEIPYLVTPVRDDLPSKVSTLHNILLLPYTSVIYHNDVFSMYYIDSITTKLDTSTNGIDWKFKSNISVNSNGTPAHGDSMYSTIRRGNTWYSGWTTHAYVGPTYTEFINIATSTNGYNYTQYSGNPLNFHPGEDLSFWDNTDSFYCYIRPTIPLYETNSRRKIGLMRSVNFFNWTQIDTVIKFPDSSYNGTLSQYYLKQPYNMNVFRIGNDWWGFMHVLRINDEGNESFNYPYSGIEGIVETHLMFSIDGRNWSYTNDKKALLPIHDSLKQIYALPTVVNDSLYIYSFESTLRHSNYSGSQDAIDFAKGKFWKIYRYRMSIDDLNLWKP